MPPFPASACHCAKDVLNHGNMGFVESLRQAQEFGSHNGHAEFAEILKYVGRLGEVPTQTPTTAVLACSDARVPVLQLFQKQPNEIYEIRLEGNVASRECLGSLLHAIEHLPSMEGVAVLGHTDCGAVTAAVDHYLSQSPRSDDEVNPIFSLVKHILFSVDVGAAAMALSSLTSQAAEMANSLDRQTLIDVAVFVNAAATAWKVQQFLQDAPRPIAVWYGVYDLATCRVLHANLDGPDSSLLLGLGSCPTAIEVNEIARILVKHLEQVANDEAARFAAAHQSPTHFGRFVGKSS